MKAKAIFCFIALIAAGTFFFMGTFAVAVAGDYPEKPIKLFVPYGAGGATDLASRVLSSVIVDYLGQPVVVVNKKGASGSICFDYVRKAKPDGYSMMMAAIGANAITPARDTTLPFKFDDLTFIARTQINPNAIVVNAKSPWKTLHDLLKALKANPGKYKFSTAGAGTIHNLAAVLLMREVGLPHTAAKAVHYDSGAAATLAVVQGEVDFMQCNTTPLVNPLKSGLLRALAVTTPKRLKDFPKVPTYTELGYPSINLVGWRGVVGPPGLPANVVSAWEKAVEKSCKSKPWIKLATNLGDLPGYLNAKDFDAFVRAEFKRYRDIFTALNLLRK
jgi:tripartite-type tricarboxylate transporter receptor subunit TctC